MKSTTNFTWGCFRVCVESLSQHCETKLRLLRFWALRWLRWVFSPLLYFDIFPSVSHFTILFVFINSTYSFFKSCLCLAQMSGHFSGGLATSGISASFLPHMLPNANYLYNLSSHSSLLPSFIFCNTSFVPSSTVHHHRVLPLLSQPSSELQSNIVNFQFHPPAS